MLLPLVVPIRVSGLTILRAQGTPPTGSPPVRARNQPQPTNELNISQWRLVCGEQPPGYSPSQAQPMTPMRRKNRQKNIARFRAFPIVLKYSIA